MPPFPKPEPGYLPNLQKELKNLANYKNTKPGRAIPASTKDNILIATWNIANLGVQEREAAHYKLISSIIQWFDIVSIQEVNDNLDGIVQICSYLPKKFKKVFTDASGNNERMCYVYNSTKLKLAEKIGEIAIAAEDLGDITLPGVNTAFQGFSRTPFLCSFIHKNEAWVFINVHAYFGDERGTESMERRALEAYAISRWADLRRKSKNCFSPRIIALGDFNLPKVDKDDPIYKALTARGLELPDHSTKIYSNIADDMEYDQIAFIPGMKSRIKSEGVFDFDGALFSDLWDPAKPLQLRNYLRYYISDHRVKWMEMV